MVDTLSSSQLDDKNKETEQFVFYKLNIFSLPTGLVVFTPLLSFWCSLFTSTCKCSQWLKYKNDHNLSKL